MRMTRFLMIAAAFSTIASAASGAGLDPAMQAKIDGRVQAIKGWASDPTIVAAVKAMNATVPSDYTTMTQEKWAGLTVLDPLVRSFTRNDAAAVLRAKKTDDVSEAFVSSASGLKVAFLAKTTNWSHKGKPKHEVPMSGRTWQGEIEMDESSGVQQIQVAVPVLDGGKPIGSLVVGLSIAKLR
jgi:lipopolysaccharide export LptBFGC system permease protein LptF